MDGSTTSYTAVSLGPCQVINAILGLVFTNISQYYKDPVRMSPLGKRDHVCIALNPRCKIPGNKIKKDPL